MLRRLQEYSIDQGVTPADALLNTPYTNTLSPHEQPAYPGDLALEKRIENIIRWNVPGSFELVYGAQRMIVTQEVDVVITIGCVIKGETMHFEFVCEGVTQGIKDLNVQTDVPVIFCLLTDNNEQQSIDRSGGIHGNKGTEAAIAAIKMAELRRKTM